MTGHLKRNFPLYILLLFFTWLFMYRLGFTALGSWDEAWYASIAREMARTGSFFHSIWNGRPFFDHPPLGFWLMAISYMTLGISDLSTRLPSAILGIGTIALIYRIGKDMLESKTIGFLAAVILGTCVWYVLRVRSGNLDSLLVFFYVLTVYLAWKSSIHFKWFPTVMASFGALLLSKTLVGMSAIALIVFMNVFQLLNIPKNWKYILLGILSFCIVTAPWYLYHLTEFPEFYNRHFVEIGSRNKTLDSYFTLMFEQPLFYLHMGVRKWYYLWLIALVSITLIGAGLTAVVARNLYLKKKTASEMSIRLRNIVFLILWNVVTFYPFLTSDKTELWHLIPVYPPLALITAYGFYLLGLLAIETATKLPILKNSIIASFISRPVVTTCYFLAFLYIAVVQFRIFYLEVIPQSRYTPDDVAISRLAGNYSEQIYLADDYLPLAIYYADKDIKQLSYQPEDINTIQKLFRSNTQDFIVITRNGAPQDLKKENIPFRLLEQNNSFSILGR